MFIARWNGTCFFHTSLMKACMTIKYRQTPLVHGAVEHTSMDNGFNSLGLLNGDPINLMAKEIVPIGLSCAVWDSIISKRTVEFRYDNHTLVDAISKGSSREGISCICLGASGSLQQCMTLTSQHLIFLEHSIPQQISFQRTSKKDSIYCTHKCLNH